MKIAIDAIAAIGRSGNATYTRELTNYLLQLNVKDDYYLFSFLHDWRRGTPFSAFVGGRVRETHPYISRTILPFDRIDIVNDRLVRLNAQMHGIELFHFTNPLNFVPGSYKSVITVHDLAALHDTSWSKANMQGVFAKKIRTVAEKASAIIAVSEYTKQDIVHTLGVPPDKITVIYEAASSNFYPDVDIAYIQQTFGVKKYVLYAGQLQPRKNALNLLKAWGAVAARFPEYKLVLVGMVRDEEYHAALMEAIRQGNSTHSVVFAGSVDNTQLRKLYSTARCFVYSSFFEGFGLPILEAMQCGTPVVTSNTSSLPEVAGDAGLLVDPSNTEDIALALERILSDDALHIELRARALMQAKKFSWNKAAQETLTVYKNIAG